MSDDQGFGEKTPRGIDLARLRYARTLTPFERLERNRRAAASVILMREAGRKMRMAQSLDSSEDTEK